MKLFTILLNIAKRIKSSFTRLASLETWKSDVVDYIIEEGKSGIWKYEKWVSGKAVVYGVFDKTFSNYSTAPNINWAAYFRTGEQGSYYDSSLVFPFTFVTLTYYNFSVQVGGNYAMPNTIAGLSNEWAVVRALCNINGSQRVIARIMAIGTWK